jgi:DNA-binding FadR family transcriptional regulator
LPRSTTDPGPRGERLHQAIARRLGTSILSGLYAPGAPFGGEIERAAELGVSRTAYREAIRILVAKGLLQSRPRLGTHVTPRSRWNLLDPEILAWTFSGDADPAFIRDLFELREIVEPAAAGFAAQRRTASQLQRMREALDEMRRHTLADARGQDADQRFHRTMIEAATNDALMSLTDSIGAAVAWTTRFKMRRTKLPRDPVDEHETVYQAIADRNSDRARAAMIELLRLAYEDMAAAGGRAPRRSR